MTQYIIYPHDLKIYIFIKNTGGPSGSAKTDTRHKRLAAPGQNIDACQTFYEEWSRSDGNLISIIIVLIKNIYSVNNS